MDGLLGTRASLMLDVVLLAIVAIVPLLAWSIYVVRVQRRYALHKRIQIALSIALLVAVTAFEVDVRLFTDWEARAAASRFYRQDTWDPVWISLVMHLLFAIPTPILWLGTLIAALRRFADPPRPGAHSRLHRRLGWLAAAGMLGTAVTGAAFYFIAFVA